MMGDQLYPADCLPAQHIARAPDGAAAFLRGCFVTGYDAVRGMLRLRKIL